MTKLHAAPSKARRLLTSPRNGPRSFRPYTARAWRNKTRPIQLGGETLAGVQRHLAIDTSGHQAEEFLEARTLHLVEPGLPAQVHEGGELAHAPFEAIVLVLKESYKRANEPEQVIPVDRLAAL